MCHNGEIIHSIYSPMEKDQAEFLREYEEAYHDLKKSKKYTPMTLEGCVVRISDIIGYIGRDIEDAIAIGKIKREELPEEISSVLGTTNKEIVNTIILDIIKNSMDKPYIKMSSEVFNAIFLLKEFNYNHIYRFSLSEEDFHFYKQGMNKLFTSYLEDIRKGNKTSIIYQLFLSKQSEEYLKTTNDKRKVIDFIAGMTDEMFIREINFIK